MIETMLIVAFAIMAVWSVLNIFGRMVSWYENRGRK